MHATADCSINASECNSRKSNNLMQDAGSHPRPRKTSLFWLVDSRLSFSFKDCSNFIVVPMGQYQWDYSGECWEVFFFNSRSAPFAAELVGRRESPTWELLKSLQQTAVLIRVFSGKGVILQRRQLGDCWCKKNSGLFSGPRTLNAHWCSTPARRRRRRRFCEDECEWQPYAGPLTHLPSWHTNPSHWFSAQRICSSAWPRKPRGTRCVPTFCVPESNTLTLDGGWRARALDEIENGVAPRFPIPIWQLPL